jgi:hypothetical protein
MSVFFLLFNYTFYKNSKTGSTGFLEILEFENRFFQKSVFI